MYVGFRGLLGTLAVVGLALGAAFGLGAKFGSTPAVPATTTAAGVPTGAAGSAAAAAGGGAAAGSGGGFAAAGGAGAVSGTVESATPTSLVVRTTDGSTVTLVLTEQTVIRKTDTGTAQDLRAGVQVLATRDGATNAGTVTIVPAGATGLGGGPRGAGGTGTPGARGTATATAAPR